MQSPLQPPPYLDGDGNPHKRGIITREPPVCSRCGDEPESIPRLEQHVRTSRSEPQSIKVPLALTTLSMDRPLSTSVTSPGNTSKEPMLSPPWMTLLPASRYRRPHYTGCAVLARRSTFPAFETMALSTPCRTRTVQIVDPLGAPSEVAAGSSREATGSPSPPSAVENIVQRPVSQTFSTLQSPSDGREEAPTHSNGPLKRNASMHTRRFSFRKPSTASSIASTSPESCGSTKSHTPIPSQDISPRKVPFIKEVSEFFTNRTATGKRG